MEKKVNVSVIVPVKNEEENILILSDEITQAMEKTEYNWECLWIDDDSNDETKNKLIELNKRDSRHKYSFHDRNYGQSAALSTGFRLAESDIIATLDGDGQNDPACIPDLVEALLKNDADMVNGWREKRIDNSIRKYSSKIANGFRNKLTGESVRDVGCALRVFKKECTREIPVFKGMHRFFPTLVRMSGYSKIIERPVNHRARERGKTKYGINNRLWVGIIDTLAVCWMKGRMVYPKSISKKKN